jgi:hypothetical protein
MANHGTNVRSKTAYEVERLFRGLIDIRLMNNPLSQLYRLAVTTVGIGVILLCMHPVYQLFTLYSTTKLVDATGAGISTTTLFLSIGSYFGAYMIRSYIVHFRAQRILQRNVTIYETAVPALSPVEAGVFIDGDWSSNETSAMIYSLRSKGVVDYFDGMWNLNPTTQSRKLPREEQVFLDEFFINNEQQIDQHSLLYGVPYMTHSLLVTRLKESRFINPPTLGFWSVVLFRLSIIVAVFIMLVAYNIFNNNIDGAIYNDISYPNQIHIWHLVVTMLVPLTVITTILNGFVTKNLYQGIRIDVWQQVAGLRLYIKQALAEKFISADQITVSSREFTQYYPYALAFELVTLRDYERLIERGSI